MIHFMKKVIKEEELFSVNRICIILKLSLVNSRIVKELYKDKLLSQKDWEGLLKNKFLY